MIKTKKDPVIAYVMLLGNPTEKEFKLVQQSFSKLTQKTDVEFIIGSERIELKSVDYLIEELKKLKNDDEKTSTHKLTNKRNFLEQSKNE